MKLEEFCEKAHHILKADSSAKGREKVQALLPELLKDENFVTEYCGPDVEGGVTELYHDADTDFRVLRHVYNKGRERGPHDHGSSWAIYGQAVGQTNMALWEPTGETDDDGKPIVKPVKKFSIPAGEAGIFHPGQIHSIEFTEGGRVVRVTGTDLSKAGQTSYTAAEKAGAA